MRTPLRLSSQKDRGGGQADTPEAGPMMEEGEKGKRGGGAALRIILTLDNTLSNAVCMHAISYSEARENLKSVIDEVVASRAPIAITRQRGESAVLVSQSEWASIEETMYLLRSPANAARLLEAIKGLDAGEGVERELIHP